MKKVKPKTESEWYLYKMKWTGTVLIGFAILCIASLIFFIHENKKETGVTDTEFMADAKIVQVTDKVGANVRLLQEIHGVNGIKYRYSVETDCPKWDFETRYMTDDPIEWVDDSSAVEVIIYDIQVRFNETVYANGQYYTVPLFGGISSENITVDEWTKNLVSQAYQTYVSDHKYTVYAKAALIMIVGAVIGMVICIAILSGLYDLYKKCKDPTP